MGSFPSDWLHFEPISPEEMNELIESSKSNSKTIAIIVEDNHSYIGREVKFSFSFRNKFNKRIYNIIIANFSFYE